MGELPIPIFHITKEVETKKFLDSLESYFLQLNEDKRFKLDLILNELISNLKKNSDVAKIQIDFSSSHVQIFSENISDRVSEMFLSSDVEFFHDYCLKHGGGFGIYLMRNIADEFEYFHENGINKFNIKIKHE